MDETTREPQRGARRGHDVHQTHFFYADDLASGATVRDHVTGQVVGEVDRVGRHVFEGYGAPAPDGGTPGDLVVEVRELEAPGPWEPPQVDGTSQSAGPDDTDDSDDDPTDSVRRRPAPEQDPEAKAPAGRDRAALRASVAQGVAIAVLAPLLALALLVVLLVLLVG